MSVRSFYCVWSPTSGTPTVRHLSLKAAEAEAERLARCNSGVEFYVLKAVKLMVKKDVEVIDLDDNSNIPF